MKLPWVSRETFEFVKSEFEELKSEKYKLEAFLRDQLRSTQEHEQRLERKEAGIREPKPEPVSDPMPDELRAIVEGYDSAQMRAGMYAEIADARRDGESWEKILATAIGSDSDA